MLFWKTQNCLESVHACVNGQSPLFPRISPGIRVMLVLEHCNRKVRASFWSFSSLLLLLSGIDFMIFPLFYEFLFCFVLFFVLFLFK